MHRVVRQLFTALLLAQVGAWASAQTRPTPPSNDVMDYFLQKDDAEQSWTLNGHDVRPDDDPEGTDAITYIGNKWSKPGCYEIFKVTPDELQIRYEVVRGDPVTGHGNWIRRYQEIGEGDGELPGHVWMPRHPATDGTIYKTHMAKDRWVFDDGSKSYVIDKSGSAAESVIAFSFSIVNTDWGDANKTGMDLNPALRLTSEWQHEGKIFETYDYGYRKGLVRWRWLERVSTLTKIEGNIFKCENGAVEVVDVGDQKSPPAVFKYDLENKTRGELLETIRFRSYWAPDQGEQLYIVYRDTLREGGIVKKNERIAHDFTLPEWISKPGATIKDLPGMYTTGPSTQPMVRPGAIWPDDRGQHIQAHGGGIIKFGDYWYWFGEDRANPDRSVRCVSCYSSNDLMHWTFCNQVLHQSDPEELGRGWVLERPKVFYNAKTKKFVMYMHLDDGRYRLARVAVATCDTIDGDYKYVYSFRPLDHESRDIGQFIDDDGTPYLIFEDRPFGFRIASLTDDYMGVDKQICLIPMHMEGGAVVHYDGLYYAIGSSLTGWNPNPNTYATAKKLEGPWSDFQDIAPPEMNTYGSQSTLMLKVVGSEKTSVIFMGDMWRPRQLSDSRYLWMPMEIGDGKLWLPEPRPWTIDVKTGQTVVKK